MLGLVFAARLSLWRKQPTRGITIAIGLLAAASVLRAPQVGDGILDQLVAPANISEMISHAFALAASCALATFALSVRQREHLIPVALRGCELWIAALMLCWSVSDASRIQVPSIAMLDGPMVAAYWLVFISGVGACMAGVGLVVLRLAPATPRGPLRTTLFMLGVSVGLEIAHLTTRVLVQLPAIDYWSDLANVDAFPWFTLRAGAYMALAAAGLIPLLKQRPSRRVN
ncbi:hypothetical protein GS938_19820 [Rhodococcus hoagii]|nr:hypothetical protein [Prescottella equi]NKV95280.1 hypothetical protein [Prescottella equi]NKW07983.1 hypothetical protein [Prescottella equi]